MRTSEIDGLTRRAVVFGTIAVAVLTGTSAVVEAQQKAAKKMVRYQEKPKGDQSCDKCLQFVAPDTCKLVEGKINPKGWCALYAPKPK